MAETPTSITTPERRTPVVQIDNDRFPQESIDVQWVRVTEAIRQDLITLPQTRTALSSLIKLPVSETLPKKAIDNVIKTDERIRKLTNRYQAELGILLNLPAVPDEQIVPDIANARRLETIDNIKQGLVALGHTEGSPKFEEYLQDDIQRAAESGRFSEGITNQERKLIAQRYRFARDVKILALGAEILEQPEGSVKFDKSGKVSLPNGVQIAVDTDQADQRADMLNPLFWQKRKQLKDRVYEIEVNARKYILKEKKTPRHTDTKRHGHQEGLSSEEEFATARYFAEHCTLEEGRIALRWEKPIGFVTYPDGFQFSVFEYEENLTTADYWTDATKNLTNQIITHESEFQAEYAAVKEAAPNYKNDIEVEFYEEKMYQGVDKDAQRRLSSIRAKLGRLVRRPIAITTRDDIENQFTFEQFALVKARAMIQEALEFYQSTIYKNNYTNSDLDGLAYRIKTEKGLQLEILGFDFEYFRRILPDDAVERLNHFIKASRETDWKLWFFPREHRRIEKASFRAILAMGGRMPEDALK